ncbi:hypothetical protein IPM65_04640 [Candidatus Roizmanbacteria bacterium]|nr:MAG: hypothetical protein IPM65_04640 [Candidatus Roizmanbacteria bacterium]
MAEEIIQPHIRPPEQREAEPWKQHMAYGSEQFESATANNHNVILLTDTTRPTKLVLGKDVALVLPKDPEHLPQWAGYPTHQESWLPLWFVVANHSQHRTPEEFEYRKALLDRVSPDERQLMRKALIHKANEFWQDYREDSETTDPRKKYKKITRTVQDILLYVDAPDEAIEDQQKYLEAHPLYPLIQHANQLRKGRGLETAPALEQQVEEVLARYTTEVGAEQARAAYDEVQKRLAEDSKDEMVILMPDKNIADARLYAELASYDLLMAEDEHDQDVVSVTSLLTEPRFYQLDTKFGPQLSRERRMDVIAVPEKLAAWDVVKGGKESYQPISMIVATHTIPQTESGQKLQARLQQELSPDMVAHHYLGAAEEFLHRDAWGKSYVKRVDKEGTKQIKKVIPLYRVACDLLPRAVYMLKTGKFPAGVENSELWEVGETAEEAQKIQELFQRQDATQEELHELAQRIEGKFRQWFKDSDYELFLSNMEKMGQRHTLTQERED